MSEALTVLDLIHRWGEERPDRTAFRFLRSDESVGEEVSYAALRRNALTIARALSVRAPVDSRALLLFETESGFVHAFFGCLAARVVAVPADPPHGRRAWGGIDRIVRDCRPATILTTRVLQQRWERQLAQLCEAHACRVLTIEDCLGAAAGDGDGPPVAPVTIDAARVAFLQYTSGSTSHPKGVMVTHANILANVRMLEETFALDSDTRMVGWLPLFHDMGLIGFVLVPVSLGCTSTILSPTAFLEKPVRWLRAITRYRGTISSSPNFAYDLCSAKIRPDDREGLDLSSWGAALNGSEPVSARTLRRFEETFAGQGLQPGLFRPCYGMAEATLLVSATEANRPIRVLAAVANANVLADAPFRIEATDVVSCGRPPRGTVIRIVDPVTRVECSSGQVGEVWFQGENVAAGYWENPSATEDAFDARLAGDDSGAAYLRTGDLGCVDESGELFLLGRIKELIIIRGRNFPPQDIEEAVAGVHDAIRAGHVAAVGLVHETEQDLAIVAEIEREHWRSVDPQAVVDAILEIVHAEFGLSVAVVTLLRPGGIPKTTSGKLKRLECARRLGDRAASDWGVLHEWRLSAPAAREKKEAGAAARAAAASTPRPVIDGLEQAELTDVILNWLRARLAQALECSPDDVADEEPFARCGLDSAVAVTLTGELAEWLRLDLDPTVFWEHAHPLALAEHLAGQVAERAGAGDPVEQV